MDYLLLIGYLIFGLFILGGLIPAFLEARRFIRYDGKMKRGLRIDAESLSKDMEDFLRRLSKDVVSDETSAFIKKRDQAVLVQPIPRFFYRNLGIWYVGYVDLSAEEPSIEYRMPISVAPYLAIFMGLTLLGLVIGPPGKTISAIIFITFLAVWSSIAHAASKRVVLRFIEKTMHTHRD
jgi:hypothetical protein